ncbi:MAG: diguanylate cyclase [Planctomycetaceae bacterium]|nr:diguanylate cyclase [Planctomycetaceae bacterium]
MSTSDTPAARTESHRFVAYVSPERRILWTESTGAGLPPPVDFTDPDAPSTPQVETVRNLVDAAFSTRVPQCGSISFGENGDRQTYSLKAFPDFSPNGQLKGVIQVVEGRGNASRTTIISARNREIHSVLDLTLCGIILYDPVAGRIQNVNRRVAQQTGYSLKELEGMGGETLFGEKGTRLLRSIYQRMTTAGDGMIWGQMLEVRSRSGVAERYFSSLRIIAAAPEADAPPVMLVSLDAAELDAITGSVRDGPNPRFVLEAMQDGLWEYDAINRTMHYSETYGQIFGPDGVPGGPGKPVDEWLDEVYPGESQNILHNWRQLLKVGVRYRMNYRIRDRNGAWRWIITTIHAILNDSHGRPARVLGFHMDISDAMQAEARLIDTEERFRTVFDNAGMGIAVSDTEGRLEQVNPALAIMLGRDQAELRGMWLSRFAHEDYRQEMRDSPYRLLRGGRRESMPERLFIRPDGREVWITLTATLSRHISDGARYVIVMAEDVTASRANRVKLQYEATHDVMTGAWNRWVLLERLDQHIHLAVRHRQPMTFCMCDLDNFKLVNNTYGHQAGDGVLSRFVEILSEAVRETDIVGRYGGEEFGIVFPATDKNGALHSLTRAADMLRQEQFSTGDGRRFTVTATFGIAGVSDGSDLRSVVASADEALYAGKQAGRDRVVLANDEYAWF